MPELPGAQILGNLANSMLDVVPVQVNWLPLRPYSSKRNVDVGMFSVEVTDGKPLQGNPNILLDLLHQIARQAREVNPLAELGRHYDLPKALVPRSLPCLKPGRNINSVTRAVKPGR